MLALFTGVEDTPGRVNMSEDKTQTTAALNTLISLALQVSSTQQQQVQNAANVLAIALGLVNEGEAAPEGEDEDQVEHGDSDTSAEEGPKVVLAEA